MFRSLLILWILLVGLLHSVYAVAAPFGFVIDSDGSGHLWRIDLNNGVATDIGAIAPTQVEALAFSPEGVLYGADDSTKTLFIIDTSNGSTSPVGPVGALNYVGQDIGMTFDSLGRLYLTTENQPELYSVNPATGAGTLVAAIAEPITGLTSCGNTLYGLTGNGNDTLVKIDSGTGSISTIGALVNVNVVDDGALAADQNCNLYGVVDDFPSQLFSVNRSTGVATLIANTSDGNTDIFGIESMAISSPQAIKPVPVPTLSARSLGILAGLIGFVSIIGLRRRLNPNDSRFIGPV